MGKDNPAPAALMAVRKRERRDQRRIPVQIGVVLKNDDEWVPLLTDNITRTGLFLQTDKPNALRELVQLEVDIGPGGPLDVVAVVRHVVSPTTALKMGLPPGMGVQFYGLSASDRQLWDDFVRSMAARITGEGPIDLFDTYDDGDEIIEGELLPISADPDETLPVLMSTNLPDTPADLAAVGEGDVTVPAGVKVSGWRVERVTRPGTNGQTETGLILEMPGRDALESFLRRDFALGAFFLPTSHGVPVGTQISVTVRHPETREGFPLECRAIRPVAPDLRGRAGVSLEILDVSDETRENFEEFVVRGSVEVELDLDDLLLE